MPGNANIDPASLPLRDIHLPEAVSWWPPAPGVWLLLALVVLLLVLLVVWLAARQRRLRIRREAIAQLRQLRQQWQQQPQAGEAASALSQLLRRVGLSYFGRSGFGGLTGPAEIECLNRLVDDERHRLPAALGEWLREAPYRPEAAITPEEVEPWLEAVDRWVRALPGKRPGRARSSTS